MLPCFVTWEHLPQRSSTPQGLPRSTWVIWHACVFVGQLCCWQNEVVSRTSWLLAHSARQRSGAALLASATMGRARFCQWNFAVCSSASVWPRLSRSRAEKDAVRPTGTDRTLYDPRLLESIRDWRGKERKKKKKAPCLHFISVVAGQTSKATTNN